MFVTTTYSVVLMKSVKLAYSWTTKGINFFLKFVFL